DIARTRSEYGKKRLGKALRRRCDVLGPTLRMRLAYGEYQRIFGKHPPERVFGRVESKAKRTAGGSADRRAGRCCRWAHGNGRRIGHDMGSRCFPLSCRLRITARRRTRTAENETAEKRGAGGGTHGRESYRGSAEEEVGSCGPVRLSA